MHKKAIKIGFMGGPGVGKTTLLNHFKKREDVTVVEEAARDYFSLNPDVDRTTYETQSLLINHIIERENAVKVFGKPLEICDRTAIDPVVYYHHYGYENEAKELLKTILDHVKTYDRLYLLDPVGVKYVQDRVRNESSEERMDIHRAYLEVFETSGIKYHLLSGGHDVRSRTVEEYIHSMLDSF